MNVSILLSNIFWKAGFCICSLVSSKFQKHPFKVHILIKTLDQLTKLINKEAASGLIREQYDVLVIDTIQTYWINLDFGKRVIDLNQATCQLMFESWIIPSIKNRLPILQYVCWISFTGKKKGNTWLKKNHQKHNHHSFMA